MPPMPLGVGTAYIQLLAEMDQLAEDLAASHLVEPHIVRSAIIYLHNESDLTLDAIVADGGHNKLHRLLWQLREGEVSIPLVIRRGRHG